MSLLKYFTKQDKTSLPDPRVSISMKVPSSAIASSNNEVQKIRTSLLASSESKKRCSYSKSFMPQIKAEMGRYTAENGVASMLIRYVSKYPDRKQSTVRTWRNMYSQELTRVRSGVEMGATSIQELPSKKRGNLYFWEKS